ncbi:hypothetical protein [Sphingomicrobium clamense]|uniref:Uncharacterized protein n=1 Tax=Sphingomicrobium clamense TaxID=2851013 RepID=A0ABS6V374_9SPHN|nr:hypothetical protein [Sphingomicrobium sp. B8]MBW0143991.1 hypothetical protein [Sphingomicrobium sp. B8]
MTPKAIVLGATALLLAGAAGATWLMKESEGVARFVGVTPSPESSERTPVALAPQQKRALPSPQVESETADAAASANAAAEEARDAIEELGSMEERVARIEERIERAEGSAGRADALLVAFAARRAIERGAPLGFLEPLLTQRFGSTHPRAVARVITASRNPVRLEDLVRRYEELGPVLRRGSEDPGFWDNLKREVGSLVIVYSADQPNPRPRARYDRALVELRLGDVSAALAETMRLPGAEAAEDWVADARRYVATRQALDRLESAALLSREENATN